MLVIGYRLARKLRCWFNRDIYRKIYEAQSALFPVNEAVGDGPYDLIGQLELNLLRGEGLAPEHTLLDLGCGNGRLAVHAVPYLHAGAYCGVDVSARLLQQAAERVRVGARGGAAGPRGGCRVSWCRQRGQRIALPAHSVDFACVFSVFTHLEHEDTYNYLLELSRVVRPGGKVIFSCLPLDLPVAADFFRQQAALEFGRRWAQVRNIVTSRDLMEAIGRLAGWQVVRWYAGNEANIPDQHGQLHALGQSSCVLGKPAIG
jgi:SAM-dependent methyltransferase